MADSHEGKPQHGAPNEPNLPIVWSPKLGASEESVEHTAASDADAAMASPADDAASEEAAQSGREAGASPARSMRFAMLAASVAAAAALGSFVGSLSASGVAHVWPATDVATTNGVSAAKPELSALKAELAGAAHNANGQFAKLADRLERLEQAQSEPAAKLARMADLLEKLEKKSTAAPPETTGSIASQSVAPEAKRTDRILPDWVVQSAQGGRVLVASRYNGVFEVVTGAVLPGIGRVEAIKRQDGQWVVVTEHGLIVER
jgi:hypothetical protein